METFKQQLLKILGLKVELKKPDESWTKSENKTTEPPKGNNGKFDSEAVQEYIRTIVDNKIRNTAKEKTLKADREKVYKDLTDDLKSFTLDDILNYVQGFDIGKGVYKSKLDDFEGENSRYSDLINNNEYFRKEKRQGTIGTWFTVIKKTEDLEPGTLILALDNKNYKFFPTGSPAQTLEEGIFNVIGGQRNAGASDAVKDLESGVEISVKCVKPGETPKPSSKNALANYKREVRYLVFEYTYKDEIKGLNKNKYFKSFVVCKLNKSKSGWIRNGNVETENSKTETNKDNESDTPSNYKDLIKTAKQTIQNDKIFNEWKNYILSIYQLKNRSDFYSMSRKANIEKDIELIKTINKIIKNYNKKSQIKDTEKVKYDMTFFNAAKKYSQDKTNKNLKEVYDIIDNINSNSSVKTNYFNY